MDRCRIALQALVEYHLGSADDRTAESIRVHIEGRCGRCLRRLERLDRTTSALRAGELPRVSAAARERVHAAFRERYRSAQRPPLFALLAFDSRLSPAAAGARSETAQALQALYYTADYDIDLWQEPAGRDTWYLIGQVLPRAGGAAIAPESALLKASDGQEWTAIGEGDEFHIASVPAGVYRLHLRLPDAEIVVAEVRVGP